ncbi:purine nucleosidase [Arboricoccus pini]|uniref:Purine nucleosidase n=1 Tax=Arboricoccus pini TaxID=1963835 RepID=A0A212QPW6_9PROT|nr:nucleoside hydrolase [Arboricoccus pini]SNB61476.1 purine nucleosidase [Arboricoccus pini]
MTRQAIIIDTDPGQDDAIAILTALGSPEAIEILGICAVAGNVPLALTLDNVRKLLELANRRDVPVFAGAEAPLTRPLVTAEHVHGMTGMDGHDFPPPTMPVQDRHAATFIVEAVMSRPAKSVTICALGPATNLALALALEPRIAQRLREIVWMGGAAVEGGNITPASEFNVHVDPEAGAKLLASGAEIVMMPLDVTHKARVTHAWMEEIRAIGGPVGIALGNLMTFAKGADERKFGKDRSPLHDPTTIAYVLQPELFAGQRVNVEIETGGYYTRGMTVVDWWGVAGRPVNVTFMRDIDAPGFFALLTDRLRRLATDLAATA